MKGVILSINPDVTLVDITHEIPPQDISSAAFTLLAAYKSFPVNTIHVAVVDPGVGSSRRALLLNAANQFFVGPDNGIFSYVMDREKNFTVFELTNAKYFHHPVSNTFHGRDIFAPVAAALALGVAPKEFGKQLKDPVRLPSLGVKNDANGRLTGRIIHIDRFGNCITNFTRDVISAEMIAEGVTVTTKGKNIREFQEFFAGSSKGDEKPFAIWGSTGFLEIAMKNKSAAEVLRAKTGDAVTVVRSREGSKN